MKQYNLSWNSFLSISKRKVTVRITRKQEMEQLLCVVVATGYVFCDKRSISKQLVSRGKFEKHTFIWLVRFYFVYLHHKMKCL